TGALGVAIVLVALGLATTRQSRIWHDDRTFWSYTAHENRYSFIAQQALAGLMQNDGHTREALDHYHRAARLRPELARVHLQFGRLLARSGRSGPAGAELRKAV